MSAGVEYWIGVVEGLKTLFTVLGVFLAAPATLFFLLIDIADAWDESEERVSDKKRKFRIVAMIIGTLLILAGVLCPTREALTLYYYG